MRVYNISIRLRRGLYTRVPKLASTVPEVDLRSGVCSCCPKVVPRSAPPSSPSFSSSERVPNLFLQPEVCAANTTKATIPEAGLPAGWKSFFLQTGMGVDINGQDPMKAESLEREVARGSRGSDSSDGGDRFEELFGCPEVCGVRLRRMLGRPGCSGAWWRVGRRRSTRTQPPRARPRLRTDHNQST